MDVTPSSGDGLISQAFSPMRLFAQLRILIVQVRRCLAGTNSRRAFGIALVFFGSIAGDVRGGATTNAAVTLDAFSRSSFDMFSGKRGSFWEYVEIYRNFDGLPLNDKHVAGQLISQIDAIYGRYDDAAKHLEMTFPNLGKSGDRLHCPKQEVQAKPALSALSRIARDARILLINESHSFVETRAFAYRLLPILREQGYRYLALEALSPSSAREFEPRDGGLRSRGYPIDTVEAGFYLREPVYAEIVRSALQMEFQLIAYESDHSKNRDDRERGQADNLASFLEKHPQAKIVVIAGYTHIWKRDGWMADRLQKKIAGKIISVDQIAGLGGCEGLKQPFSKEPYILSVHGKLWSSQPDGVDVTVLRSVADSRSSDADWLTLGEVRRPVKLPSSVCRAPPCLVSAYYADEPMVAVPADRLAIMEKRIPRPLYLKPGNYRVVIKDAFGTRIRSLSNSP